MTKEKTARLIPNAIQVCTDSEKVSEATLGPSTPWHPSPQHPHPISVFLSFNCMNMEARRMGEGDGKVMEMVGTTSIGLECLESEQG